MIITIPEEYRERFGSERMWFTMKEEGGGKSCAVQNHTFVFVSQYIKHGVKHGLLLMNSKERNRLVSYLNQKIAEGDGISRLMKAGIVRTSLQEGGLVEVPDDYGKWLGSGEPRFEITGNGLAIF